MEVCQKYSILQNPMLYQVSSTFQAFEGTGVSQKSTWSQRQGHGSPYRKAKEKWRKACTGQESPGVGDTRKGFHSTAAFSYLFG